MVVMVLEEQGRLYLVQGSGCGDGGAGSGGGRRTRTALSRAMSSAWW